MSIKITAPVADFDGKIAGVRFDEGTATMDPEKHAAALAYFRRHPEYKIGSEGGKPTTPDAAQQQAQADAGLFVPDEKLAGLTGEQLKDIAKRLEISASGSKSVIAERIIEKRAENGKQSIEQHDARDGADRDGDGVQDVTTTPASNEVTPDAAPAAPANAEVKGASEHESVREVSE